MRVCCEKKIPRNHRYTELVVVGTVLLRLEGSGRGRPVRSDQVFASQAEAVHAAQEILRSCLAAGYEERVLAPGSPETACSYQPEKLRAQQAALEGLVTAAHPIVPGALALLTQLGATHPDIRLFYEWCGNPDAVFGAAPFRWYSLADALSEQAQHASRLRLPGLLIGREATGLHVFANYFSGKIELWDHESREVLPLAKSLPEALRLVVTALRRSAAKAAAPRTKK